MGRQPSAGAATLPRGPPSGRRRHRPGGADVDADRGVGRRAPPVGHRAGRLLESGRVSTGMPAHEAGGAIVEHPTPGRPRPLTQNGPESLSRGRLPGEPPRTLPPYRTTAPTRLTRSNYPRRTTAAVARVRFVRVGPPPRPRLSLTPGARAVPGPSPQREIHPFPALSQASTLSALRTSGELQRSSQVDGRHRQRHANGCQSSRCGYRHMPNRSPRTAPQRSMAGILSHRSVYR